jgi:hypothetical protein
MKLKFDNENEVDPWSPLGLAALTILNRLQCKRRLLELAEEKKEERKDETKPRDAADDYLEQSVARIEQFERSARGLVPHRSRRQRE